jgi:molybdopterin molybdotransferase
VNVHHQAADRRRGDVLLRPGTRLGPAELAVAATVGAAEISVVRAPRVAVVSTGDELVEIRETPLPHQIRRSNAYALHALFEQAGAEVSLFHLPDERAALRRGLVNILDAGFDAVVLSGAVSKGRADHLPGLLRELEVAEIFHEVNQRPGKPLWFGARAAGPVVFGLPGNPVSTFLTACRYVRPWLQASQQPADATATVEAPAPAVLTVDIHFKPQLTHFVPVRLETDAAGRRLATPLRVGGSGDLAGLLGATAFWSCPRSRWCSRLAACGRPGRCKSTSAQPPPYHNKSCRVARGALPKAARRQRPQLLFHFILPSYANEKSKHRQERPLLERLRARGHQEKRRQDRIELRQERLASSRNNAAPAPTH